MTQTWYDQGVRRTASMPWSPLIAALVVVLAGCPSFSRAERSGKDPPGDPGRSSTWDGPKVTRAGPKVTRALARPTRVTRDPGSNPSFSYMFRGDARRTGRTAHRIPTRRPDVLWIHRAGRPVFASPALTPDRGVVTASLDGTVTRLSSGGEVLWRFDAGGPVFASPAVRGGSVWVGSDAGGLLRLSLDSGEPVCRVALGACPDATHAVGFGPEAQRCHGDGSPVLLASGRVAMAAADLVVLDEATAAAAAAAKEEEEEGHHGKERLRAALPGHAFSSVASAPDSTLVVGTRAGVVVAVGAGGEERWRHQARAECDATPVITRDSAVVLGCDDGILRALDLGTGQLRWRYRTRRAIRSSAAAAPDGTLWVGSDDGHLHGVGPDGKARARVPTGGPVRSSPVVDGAGTVVFGSQDHHIYAVNAAGKVLWRLDLHADVDSSVAVAPDGTLYVGCDSGRTFALGLKKSK